MYTKRDIQRDRELYDRERFAQSIEFSTWNDYVEFLREALPYYMDRCEQGERRLRDAVELLAQALRLLPDYPSCHRCPVAGRDLGDCFPNGTSPYQATTLVNRIKAFLQNQDMAGAW